MNEPRPPFAECALQIARDLCRDAIWWEDRCNWLGSWPDSIHGQLSVSTRSFGADLYAGTAGVGFFLASAATLAQDEEIAETASAALRQAAHSADDLPPHGFYGGQMGVAFALLRAAELGGRTEWHERGLELLRQASAKDSAGLDVISGPAGSIPLLVSLGKRRGGVGLLDRAVALGDQLLRAAEKGPEGWSWKTVPSRRNLTGYSHGAAGIALALLELFAATGENRFEEGAKGGFAYERSAFDRSAGNWPDFRDEVGPQGGHPLAWCHGAPGIALSRLRAARLSPGPEFEEEARIGLQTTAGFARQILRTPLHGQNFCLCHGLAGNVEALLESGIPEWVAVAEEVGRRGIQRYGSVGNAWPSGIPAGEPTPGLMMGQAGTGYFYLRLADPDRFPTVLLSGVSGRQAVTRKATARKPLPRRKPSAKRRRPR